MNQVSYLKNSKESMAANLWAEDLYFNVHNELDLYNSRVFNTIAKGYRIDPIGPEFVEAVYSLKVLNSKVPKYRGDSATTPPDLNELSNIWNSTSIIFGIFFDELLIGVLGTQDNGDGIELLFCHIDADHQNNGVASGVVAFAILTWVNMGYSHFYSESDREVPARQEVLGHLDFIVRPGKLITQ